MDRTLWRILRRIKEGSDLQRTVRCDYAWTTLRNWHSGKAFTTNLERDRFAFQPEKG
jgi:hypothetical protein